MKVATAVIFGIGYVVGSKAGRERYEQICALARNAAKNFDAAGTRQRLEALAAQLDGHSSGATSRRAPTE
jgi:hypothetical protein